MTFETHSTERAGGRIELRGYNRLSRFLVSNETLVLVHVGGVALEAVPAGGRRQILDFLMPDDAIAACAGVTSPGFFLRALTKATVERSSASTDGTTQSIQEATTLLLAATLGKWSRFPAAKEWLDKVSREQTASVRREFDEYLRANTSAGSPMHSPEVRRQLFEEFLKWSRRATGAPNRAPVDEVDPRFDGHPPLSSAGLASVNARG
jgi:hypothetical protein